MWTPPAQLRPSFTELGRKLLERSAVYCMQRGQQPHVLVKEIVCVNQLGTDETLEFTAQLEEGDYES